MRYEGFRIIFLCICFSFVVGKPPLQLPNIAVVLADDTGHADIGYSEGNLQASTGFINKLAYDGVILDSMYTNPICSPSRAALLTGKDTIHTGMQTDAIGPGQPWGLPTHFKLLPQFLKDLGYYTALLGKWHLGSFTRAHWPIGCAGSQQRISAWPRFLRKRKEDSCRRHEKPLPPRSAC
ncbi:hypothetical protein RvY_14988-3 [Ramazzottius varieornatus]|uniref:Sulfatase N-terminal domain-containing protein n=1 Tax=Ramazzottius varieornatus TaxID=947166 RepID=A0A1D1W1J8_RAMVA|nr:hypothetical protein RvY_14988-3 [Ramazzottius varieornatus]